MKKMQAREKCKIHQSHTLEFDLLRSEDDNATSATPFFVVLLTIFSVFDLSHEQKSRKLHKFSKILPATERRNENKETSSDFHCCVTNKLHVK
jgi:hypothetical protein